jgi:hypothetical protein
MTASRMFALVCLGIVLALLLTVVVVAVGQAPAAPEHGITRTVDPQYRTVCYTLGGTTPTAISCVHVPGRPGTSGPGGPSLAGETPP